MRVRSRPALGSGSITTGGSMVGRRTNSRPIISHPIDSRSVCRAAIEQADEYVWIYTEKPRWWSEAGRRVDLPAAYVETVQRVRRGLLPSFGKEP